MFSFVGKLTTVYVLLLIVPVAYWRLIRPATDWSEYEGEWALVTGSSYGIGSEFAMSLAKRGINVILTARTLPKLEEVKHKINLKYPNIKVWLIQTDVLKDNWEQSLDQLKDINVSIVVNNIGGGNIDGTVRLFHEFSEEHHLKVHKMNLFSTQKVLQKFLPQMVSRKKGRIINLSSLSVFYPYKLSVYPGDKSFINTLTEQLNTEYESFNIRAESLLVGEVSTPGLGNQPTDGFKTCNPDQITENTLDLWGWSEVYSPFWGHSILVLFTENLLPRFMIRTILRNQIDTHTSKNLNTGRSIINQLQGKKEL